jgi:hypothetical protein
VASVFRGALLVVRPRAELSRLQVPAVGEHFVLGRDQLPREVKCFLGGDIAFELAFYRFALLALALQGGSKMSGDERFSHRAHGAWRVVRLIVAAI